MKKQMQNFEDIKEIFNVNVIGTMNVIRFACKSMLENEKDITGQRGVIINVSSVCAFDSYPNVVSFYFTFINILGLLYFSCAYSATKGAIASLTLPLAGSFGENGIRFMCIAPGIFDTQMTNSTPEESEAALNYVPFPKRYGDPLEFGSLVYHIIENRYLNGEVIRLDGATRPKL
ncbi:unnamed protein product [Dracunculus medinensis]|uniref:3-hydroxyacyl-CoA dehydrogenase type-2 n=1 Tax=Dracunculus medinensis TaxID=318479 RepID=A0A0N4URB6_DRAME|nr:unnamed protein product [Dracunculus medinensis]